MRVACNFGSPLSHKQAPDECERVFSLLLTTFDSLVPVKPADRQIGAWRMEDANVPNVRSDGIEHVTLDVMLRVVIGRE